MVATRRDIHQHPELSGEETRTAALIAQRLRETRVDGVAEGVADTGVIGWIRGSSAGPTILVRADIDALPLAERDRGQPYISQVPGKHHGCGHDGHTAILLATAEVLVEQRSAIAGSVLLFFQPAEERGGGARRMLASKAWPDDLQPVASLALHIMTGLRVGTVDVRSGPVTASAQSFDVRFSSRGGHAANPHLTPDPVVCSAEFIMAVQTIVSRNLHPRSSTVVGLSVIHGGETRSAIPAVVDLQGTMRTYDDNELVVTRRRIRQIAEGVAATHGCTAHVEIKEDTYPAGINDQSVADVAAAAARDVLGSSSVTDDLVLAGADDMAEILLDVPGCYFFVGGGNESRQLIADMHSPEFDFDEEAMTVGAEVLLKAITRLLTDLAPDEEHPS